MTVGAVWWPRSILRDAAAPHPAQPRLLRTNGKGRLRNKRRLPGLPALVWPTPDPFAPFDSRCRAAQGERHIRACGLGRRSGRTEGSVGARSFGSIRMSGVALMATAWARRSHPAPPPDSFARHRDSEI